jgi:tRNA (guanine-N7-)-methyltransferase
MMTVQIQKLDSLFLPWPTDWTALFGADRPLILEIGFGRGAFLFHLAQQNSDANVIGLEISNRCLVKAEQRLLREQTANLRVIRSRAETALSHLFQPSTLAQVFINFPDPWFKSDHARRRLLQRDTVDVLVSRLQPNGDLYLATDILAYAEMSAELLADTPGLENQFASHWVNAMPGRVVTKYEAKARAEGRTCCYFHYRRNTLPAPDVPVIKEATMPHVVFYSPLSLEEMRQRFEPFHHSEGNIHVGYSAVFQGEHTLLFEIHVPEPTIEQHAALLLTQRRSPAGQYTLQLSSLGHARPTEGMHVAVTALGNWLLSLHPDAALVEHKLRETSTDQV